MRTLLVHPSGLMYSEIFLRLEPLGVERVAAAARAAGHEVRLLDLQVFSHEELVRELDDFRPEAVGFGLNYLANVPEVIEFARLVKSMRPGCLVFAGGHSVSFIAPHVVAQADGAIDAIVRGEGEVAVPPLLEAARDGNLHKLPGVVTAHGSGPAPKAVINRKHLGVAGLAQTAGIAARLLLRGQTNFVRMLWRFSSVYNGDRQLADHQRPIHYELPQPSPHSVVPGRRELYVHENRPRGGHRTGTVPARSDAS